jgi:hypothetical protein
MKSIPRIRIVKRLQQDIKRYGIPRAKAHPHFAMEDYKTALDLALEAEKGTVLGKVLLPRTVCGTK